MRVLSSTFRRSLRVGDRLGGHFVLGHVDTVASLFECREQQGWQVHQFEIGRNWTQLMVPKGSIAVDGVSLTLVTVAENSFSVMVIPHTLATTTLGILEVGGWVNVEVDILAKHIQKLVHVTE